jgi:hypothetical protein
MEVKKFFWQHCRVQFGNGARTSFWEDQRIGPSYLAKTFPRLFLVSMNRNVTVQKVFDAGVEGLRFRRAMVGGLRDQWNDLKSCLKGLT